MACRGTGRVISNLGGSPSTVACPWCEGSGLRRAEIDAQAHWAAGQEGAGDTAQATDPPAAKAAQEASERAAEAPESPAGEAAGGDAADGAADGSGGGAGESENAAA